MGQEVDLLANYPRTKRNVSERGQTKTEQDRVIARQFGKEFFDGDRKNGYGGFSYHPRFWQPVIPDFQNRYALKSGSRILDIGCAKGFMLYDAMTLIPGLEIAGIDISEYAIENAVEPVKPYVQVGNALSLPYPDNHFDLVVSVTTIHNLDRKGCVKALQEIERVSKGNSFITIDAYRGEEERERMFSWNLTAQTILHVEEWKALFKEAGYGGDYYWFMP